MKSSDRSEALDLARGLPTTEEDVAALRRVRSASRLTLEEYLAFLDSLPQPAHPLQSAKHDRRGDLPFTLR